MTSHGIVVKGETGSKRVELQCKHQSGILYVVPAEASWVCSDELRHVHALAGFLKALEQLDDPRVREMMQLWGLYYRERPLEPEQRRVDEVDEKD